MIRRFLPVAFAAAALPVYSQRSPEKYSFTDAQAMLKRYCAGCHTGKAAAGGFNIPNAATMKSLHESPRTWARMLSRVREGEMPPKGAPSLKEDQREQFLTWADTTLKTAACADGISPGPAPIRRLNRNEYAASVRDLLNIHVNAGHSLPADGAGGEGFDNAAETLFLSPIHAEKYLEAAKSALEYGAKDPRSRSRYIIAEPNDTTTADDAARKILDAFVPRAFRRPAFEGEVDKYMALFAAAQKRGENFDESIAFALAGVLVSPNFLFRIEEPNPAPTPRLLDNYALASRLSYFLWGSMPDQTLFDLAKDGKLKDPAVLSEQTARMLKDQKSREFAESFVEQWLGTRELGRDIKPDQKLFAPYYESEVQSGIRYEPILFFQELLAENLSLLNLIDSKFTVVSNKLARFYGFPKIEGLRQQPKRVDLPEGSRRGGLFGMAAVLAVSSQPHRTSAVLRGKFILDAILGTPPPPPPPNVPELKEEHGGTSPQTLREMFTKHRDNPACASCHNRIDPLGFALDNYDVIGRWRTEEGGQPIDTSGQLPDGTKIDGPDQLKAVILERKELFLKNLTAKLLGYALGRGLTLEEYCTVDRIVAELEKNNYSAQTLVREIVLSVPFRYQAGTVTNAPVTKYDQRSGVAE